MHKHTLTWVVIFGVIAAMFVQLPQMAAKQDAVLNTYSALVEVDALAKQQFVESIDDDRLVEGAIRGMMLQLDPYSGYIAPQELAAFERRTRGDFIGVGLEVGFVNGAPTVIAPIEGSPAAKAGIRPGDHIVSINDSETKGLSIFDIEERLGGRPGTAIRLQVRRPGEIQPREIIIVRGPVTIGTIAGFRRDTDGQWDFMIDRQHRIGYIRATSFYDNTMRDFDAALGCLLQEKAAGLIIDLRANPGGLLTQAVEMVDRFVSHGVIVSTVTRRRAVQEYFATESGTVRQLELAVLIDRSSASSSEIVAGSLQDHGRAVIIGERSFGKGSVQHLLHLAGQKAALKLTVAYYRLPNGRIIHRTPRNARLGTWGVLPDMEIRESRHEGTEGIRATERRSDEATKGRMSFSGDIPAPQHLAEEDPYIQAALQILRSRLVEEK